MAARHDDDIEFYDKNGELIVLRALYENGTYVVHTISTTAEHQRVHSGQSFMAGNLWEEGTAVADNASAEILVQVGANPLHLIQDVAAGGDCAFAILKGVTFSGAGTALTVFNKNDTSVLAADVTITHTPTGISGGTAWPAKAVPGGAGGGGGSPGGSDGNYNRENILAANTDYLFRVTNRSGAATQISITLEFYDPLLSA